MIWSLSMMTTARVRLPYVASISMLLSLASWMTLLIGADSGLTMATSRLAFTMFPNPMLISFIKISIPPLRAGTK